MYYALPVPKVAYIFYMAKLIIIKNAVYKVFKGLGGQHPRPAAAVIHCKASPRP